MKVRNILLASHGTAGAVAAEKAALALLSGGGRLHHLVVVPDFWKGMMGDDWLNNAVTRIRFGRYVENELQREIAEHVTRLGAEAEDAGVAYDHEVRLGNPSECLLEAAASGEFDLVVIGAPRPRRTPGYRSRMTVEPLVKESRVPLLVVPHPGT